MSSAVEIQNGENFPLTLTVDDSGGVTGLSPTVAIRDGVTVDSYLDWADNTFKASGWTTLNGPMTEIGGGHYTRNLDTSLLSLTPGQVLVAEYSSPVGVAMDQISIQETAPVDVWNYQIDAITDRLLAGGALNAVRQFNFNRLDSSTAGSGTLTLYDDDGTTVLGTYTLRDAANNAIVSTAGVPALRGALT